MDRLGEIERELAHLQGIVLGRDKRRLLFPQQWDRLTAKFFALSHERERLTDDTKEE